MNKVQTWHVEFIVAATLLFGTALLSHKGLIEWIGVCAVLLTFGHAQIADRLHERESLRSQKSQSVEIECYWKLNYYFYAKEILWFIYFIYLGAYAALVGVGIFLLYPLWRKWWRRNHPINR